MASVQHTRSHNETTQIMEAMDSTVDAGTQEDVDATSTAATAAAAAALQVLATQPPTDSGQCRCIYGNMLQLATGQIIY